MTLKSQPELTTQDLSPAVVRACREISAFLTKIEHATKKIDQYERSIGKHIATIKKARPDDWEEIVKAECRLGRSRAYELMAIADGTKTAKQVRDQTNARKIKHRAKPSVPGTDNELEAAQAHAPELETERVVNIDIAALPPGVKIAEACVAKREAAEGKTVIVSPEEIEIGRRLADAFKRWVGALVEIVECHADLGQYEAETTEALRRYLNAITGEPVSIFDLLNGLIGVFEEKPVEPDPSAEAAATGTTVPTDDGLDVPEYLVEAARRRTALADGSLGAAVADAFSELEELACECREVVDSAPEGVSATQRIETLNETAEVLEGLSAPDVSAELAEIKVSPPKHRKARSRGDRRDVAVGLITACIEVLNTVDKVDPRHQEARHVCSELESASSEAECCEFPGMYQ
jgi:hypothetical protein